MRLKLSKEIVELVSVMFYQIWVRRNAFIFQNQFSKLESISIRARSDLSLFKENNKERSKCAVGTQERTSIPRWEPPVWPYVKANFDAAFDKEKECMGGGGVVIRDSDGSVQAALTFYKDHISSALQVESTALLRAMELCSELGFNQVCFEGDAKLVVDAVNSKRVDNS
ncbi:hypothetical protein F2P56_026941 [Juglans regia]|uniref:RNase H type-1 domain-containing protein n=2 Tax=Juglans regia TaxID=51240 RepID=A0A833TNV5_JUGRE|nr:uncharacterized protein LOC109020820 [Juglans regia]KAF5451881.1 hypothetical protein F2P56_026941 [Juglans regia]